MPATEAGPNRHVDGQPHQLVGVPVGLLLKNVKIGIAERLGAGRKKRRHLGQAFGPFVHHIEFGERHILTLLLQTWIQCQIHPAQQRRRHRLPRQVDEVVCQLHSFVHVQSTLEQQQFFGQVRLQTRGVELLLHILTRQLHLVCINSLNQSF